MIALLLAAAPIAEMPGGDAARFAACAQMTKDNPKQALIEAQSWAARSTDVPARHCLALAYAVNESWLSAAVAFEQAANTADSNHDGRAVSLWAQAGNAALAGDDPMRARSYLDHALNSRALAGQMRGEALLDRARADVAINDLATARIDLDAGLAFVPEDPFAWLLSAALARRQGDLTRATKDIAEASRRAPDDADVSDEIAAIAAAKAKIAGPPAPAPAPGR
jgi:tetratricopeptide (TPR) repeat protein